jgi:hypothetical protein
LHKLCFAMLFLLGNLVMLVAGAAGLNWNWRCS